MLRYELLDSSYAHFLPFMSLNKLSNISKSGRNLLEQKKNNTKDQ